MCSSENDLTQLITRNTALSESIVLFRKKTTAEISSLRITCRYISFRKIKSREMHPYNSEPASVCSQTDGKILDESFDGQIEGTLDAPLLISIQVDQLESTYSANSVCSRVRLHYSNKIS